MQMQKINPGDLAQYKLIKFTAKAEARDILRGLSDYRKSSLYKFDGFYYLLITTRLPDGISKVSNLSAGELELYNWAKSEVDDSIEFIVYETRSVVIENARQLTLIGGHVILRTFEYLAEVFGILNYTTDSFSDGGKYNSIPQATSRINDLISSGVTIIDIGAESTRPGATVISSETEIQILKPLLESIGEIKQQFSISIDTYHPETVVWLLNQDIDFINDVSGSLPLGLVSECVSNGKRYIAMHNLGIPAHKSQVLDLGIDPVGHISSWAMGKIEQFTKNKIDLNKIIIDPGIGFGNNPAQAWHIIKHVNQLRLCGVELLVGHSRKSFLNHITTEKDIANGIVAAWLCDRVDYLRLHDVSCLNNIFPVYSALDYRSINHQC